MGYDALLDSAALEIVRNMPLWIPASDENGLPIVASYRLQILFDLDLDIDSDFEFEEELIKSTKGHWAGFELGFQLNTNGFLDPTTTFATTPYWENNLSKALILAPQNSPPITCFNTQQTPYLRSSTTIKPISATRSIQLT
jgi:hypothetical protein